MMTTPVFDRPLFSPDVIILPGVPKKATCLFENNNKTN